MNPTKTGHARAVTLMLLMIMAALLVALPKSAHSDAPPSGFNLSFQGYDFDGQNEETITFNGQFLVSVPSTYTPANGGTWVYFDQGIPSSMILHGVNTVSFTHANFDCPYFDKVQNLAVSSQSNMVYSNATVEAVNTSLSCTYTLTYTFTVGAGYAGSHAPIVINSNADFTPSNGVTGGTGTASAPYIIQGWDITTSTCCQTPGIIINDTRAFFVIRMVNVHYPTASSFPSLIDVNNATNFTITQSVARIEIDSSGWAQAADNIGTVSVIGSSHISIEGNNSPSGVNGPYISSSSNITVSGNYIHCGDCLAVQVHGSDHVTISENSISGGPTGIHSSTSTYVLDNRIAYVAGWGEAPSAISVYDSSGMVIARNSISNSSGGVLLNSTSDIRVFHNNFSGNGLQASDTFGMNNFWDNGYPSGGNYWSDYNGTDQDMDGVGDTPYVFSNNQDNYPLMTPHGTYAIAWKGYDWDGSGEETVALNGQLLGTFPSSYSPQNGGTWTSFSLNTLLLVQGTNTLTFTHANFDCPYSDQISNLVISRQDRTIVYSNPTVENINTATDCTNTVTYTFTIGAPRYALSFQGFDFDGANEETLSVNGAQVASVPSSLTTANGGRWVSFLFDITGYVVQGANTISFTHANFDCAYSDRVQNLVVTNETGTVYSDATIQNINTSTSCTNTITYTFTV